MAGLTPDERTLLGEVIAGRADHERLAGDLGAGRGLSPGDAILLRDAVGSEIGRSRNRRDRRAGIYLDHLIDRAGQRDMAGIPADLSEHDRAVEVSGMMTGVLVAMSGLPGSGKSAIANELARELAAPVLAVDPIEAAIWRCGIPPSFETGVAAYEVAAALAEQQLALGLTVITDSVSSLEVARTMWRQAAARSGAELAIIEVICSDEIVHRERLARRERDIPGFPEPSWADVQSRRAEWEPWIDAHLTVDTVRSLDSNVGDALAYLRR